MKYVVAVRTLCEFAAKRGDLDLRFTPTPSAQEGMDGHRVVSARRGAGYQREVTLEAEHRGLVVRGRADGYDPASNRLEEIKTHRGDLARVPDNHRTLHWAQARCYAWLMCRQLGRDAMSVALVYYDVGTQQETVLVEEHGARELQTFFEDLCDRFMAWAQQESAHREQRDAALAAMAWPHSGFRKGQRELATAVYNAARSGRCLMAQASTGIGKTLGTLFPLLKACPGQGIDKVYFLAAKTPGRRLALEALSMLAGATPDASLRVVELVARDKACEHPDRACHGESCPLARGFYDRLGAAREEALRRAMLHRTTLREIALMHGVCPYYLAQELTRWADVVVGDYNYYFDFGASLHALTVANGWRVGVLVDEAHNLIDRARSMYTAELSLAGLRHARRSAPAPLKRVIDRLRRQWKAIVEESQAPYRVLDTVPRAWAAALQGLAAALGEHFAQETTAMPPPQELLQLHFDALHFQRVMELLDEHSLFEVHRGDEAAAAASTLCVRNVVPAPYVQPRVRDAACMVLFSATLVPAQFHADMLGLPDDTVWLDAESPFRAEQLELRVAGHISTRWRDRDRSLAPIAQLMAAQFERQPGNYLAFFSSFDYLEAAASALRERHGHVPVWAQSRGMSEAEREAFLARFTPEGAGIGFAVLGGAFAEGIDLPGRRLVGAFVATLGMPQVNPVNEEMRRRMQRRFGRGYDYAYFYPGLQKVVQAAGRVIRTEEDTGVVVLMDDRFLDPKVMQLLPGWWKRDAMMPA